MFDKLYSIERDLKDGGDKARKFGRQERSLPVLTQLKNWIEKTQPKVTVQNALSKAIAIWPATGAGRNAKSSTATCRSTITPPSVPSAPLSSAERTGCSVARPRGKTSVQLDRLVETAKANSKKPYARQCKTLERLPQAPSVEDYDALLPWN